MTEQRFEQQLASKLRDSEQQLDAETVERLAALRKEACVAVTDQQPEPRKAPALWLLAASVATLGLLIALWQPANSPMSGGPQIVEVLDQLEPEQEGLLSPEEQLDLELLEDMEFYAWLALEEELG